MAQTRGKSGRLNLYLHLRPNIRHRETDYPEELERFKEERNLAFLTTKPYSCIYICGSTEISQNPLMNGVFLASHTSRPETARGGFGKRSPELLFMGVLDYHQHKVLNMAKGLGHLPAASLTCARWSHLGIGAVG